MTFWQNSATYHNGLSIRDNIEGYWAWSRLASPTAATPHGLPTPCPCRAILSRPPMSGYWRNLLQRLIFATVRPIRRVEEGDCRQTHLPITRIATDVQLDSTPNGLRWLHSRRFVENSVSTAITTAPWSAPAPNFRDPYWNLRLPFPSCWPALQIKTYNRSCSIYYKNWCQRPV